MATKKIKRFQEGGVSDKEYRADPFGAMTKKERDARVGSVDDFFSRIASKAEPRAIATEEDAILRFLKENPRVKKDAMEEANAQTPIAVPAGPRADMRPNAGVPTPAVNRPFVAPAKAKAESKSKQRVVSKKELEESGLSLRDFLNRERGLTRRGMSKAEAEKQLGLGKPVSQQEVADAKKQLGLGSSPARAPGGDAKRRNADTTSTPARTPGGNSKRGGPTSEEEANIMATGGKVKAKTYAKGGMTRGDGICVKGKTKGKFV